MRTHIISTRVTGTSLALLLTICAAPSIADAQTDNAAVTPAVCIKGVNDWRTAQVAPAIAAYRAANDTNRADLQAKYIAANNAATVASQAKAMECAAAFSVTTVPPSQLADLIALYALAKDTSGTRRASDRLMTENGLPARVRAQALLLAMNRAISSNSTFGILPEAEAVVKQIDALPDSLSDIKLQAHTTMLGRYEYLDVAEGLNTHATAVISLARTLKQPRAMISGYSSLARSFADRLHPDSALRILNTGEKEIGATAVQSFADFRHRYELIGKPAPMIDAAWWINTKDKSVMTPVKGNVTLIEFTAHWCGPCKNSYPGLRGLADKFKGKPFTGVMVTQLFGYLGTQKNLTEAQEVEADKEYFGKEHSLPFPVAINSQMKQAGNTFVQPKPDEAYRVGGIPQIMIVDKHGIIRQIVTGWDQGNTERFSRLIEELLAEKP